MPNIPFPYDFPFSLSDMRSEFDRLLDRVWHAGLNTAPLDGQDWAPLLDVTERPDAFEIRVEVPGVTPTDVDVSILGNVLTVQGNKVAPVPSSPESEGRRVRSECRYGAFLRKFEFPAEVEDGTITASCKNGVLNIRVPKKAAAKGRSVKVENQE